MAPESDALLEENEDLITNADAHEESQAEVLSVAEGERKIIWQAKDFSIREFHSMTTDGELIY